MLTKVAENLYKKTVPLPNNPLRDINAYIITGEKNLLIDTGFNRPECEEALQSAFDELASGDGPVHHPSAFGPLRPDRQIRRESSTIYAGETDGELINFETGNLYWRMLDDLFIKYGFPKATFGRNTDIHPGRKYCQDTRVNFTYVADGDVLHYGGYDLRVVETPGHTPAICACMTQERSCSSAATTSWAPSPPTSASSCARKTPPGLSGEPEKGGAAASADAAFRPRHPGGGYGGPHP